MEDEILKLLSETPDEGQWPDSYQLAHKLNAKHEDVVGIFKSLASKNYLILEQLKQSKFELNEEGLSYAKNGTPEYHIFSSLIKAGGKAEKADLEKEMGAAAFKIGLQNGVKKFFTVEKTALQAIKEHTLENTTDKDSIFLAKLGKTDFFDKTFDELNASEEVKNLKKRKLFEVKALNYYKCKKGPSFSSKLVNKRADLTHDDLANLEWKNLESFKEINLKSLGKELEAGGLHPLLKMRSEYRQILLEMGFEEMKTNRFIESSFWNFDSLYQPQQHPARDAQDTFFLKNPAKTKLIDPELKAYMEKVKAVHEKGFKHEFSESTGWKYPWSEEESMKNIFRTHTTAISSRYLKQLADEYNRTKVFHPKKLFSIDRVYRNETLDATHLAEFHQIEGLIIGKNLGLHHLKTFIREFFAKIGITELKFKPAYNPYTEPSMEIFCFHPVLKRNVEIGNSGVFRPEMLIPMGWPSDVGVVAWGLSLERPAMIHFACGNIRELVGHKVPLKNVHESQVITY